MYENFIEVDRFRYEDLFENQEIASERKLTNSMCKVVSDKNGKIIGIHDHCYDPTVSRYFVREDLNNGRS